MRVLVGFCAGWHLKPLYHKQGPNNPADAPAMVAMGLINGLPAKWEIDIQVVRPALFISLAAED